MKIISTALIAAWATSVSAYSHNHITALLRASNPSVDITPPSQDPWYTAPSGYEHAAPGAILRIRVARGNLTSVSTNSSEAYQLLYRTTDSQYQPTWAVTTLFLPANGTNSTGDKFLSYQTPYDSADVDASPSYALYGTSLADVSYALGLGWVVSVPDYEGPLASFTAGVMSGHATIDGVRAVLNSGIGLNANISAVRYAMLGYSGGALASEWAAELQNQYAPELKFAGAALGGLTPNTTNVLISVTGGIAAGLIPAGILGLASQWPDLLELLMENLNTEGEYNATTFFMARNETLAQSIGAFAFKDITKYFKNGIETLMSPIAQRASNNDGIMGYHGIPQMPLFAYKAIGDEISPINDTDTLVARYCAVGATIKFDRNTIGNHETEGNNGALRSFAFLEAVLGGTYNATGCQIQNVTVNATSSNNGF